MIDSHTMIKDISTLRKHHENIFQSEEKIEEPSSIRKKPFEEDKSESCIVDLSADSVVVNSAKKFDRSNILNIEYSDKKTISEKSGDDSYSISLTSNDE